MQTKNAFHNLPNNPISGWQSPGSQVMGKNAVDQSDYRIL